LLQLGSDHNTVKAKLNFWRPRQRRDKPKRKEMTKVDWAGIGARAYAENLKLKLDDAAMDIELDEKCKLLEHLMTEAAAAAVQPSAPTEADTTSDKLHSLLRERANAPRAERKRLSKTIKAEIKTVRRLHSEAKINTIISNMRGLGKIAGSKTCQERIR